ncbi:MAG TPA: M23 family metallopeptidase [Rhizomicrobium sp.]|nr:M23 family metallopeptidase [Rhizomicrobium sp.]
MRGRVAVLLLLGLGGCANLHEQLKPDLADDSDYPQATYYSVVARSGDSTADVAARYGTDADTLSRVNDLHGAPAPGQVLKVPANSHVVRTRILAEATGKPFAPVKAKPVRVAVLPPPRPRAAPFEDATPQSPSILDQADSIIDGLLTKEPDANAVAVAIPHARPDDSETQVASVEPQAAPTPQASVTQDSQLAANAHFVWPITGRVISPFGASASGERNDGINIAASEGEKIHAAAGGVVTYAGDALKSYGNLVLIKHDDGYVTAYAHAANILVAKGTRVEQGQVIALAGSTGDVDSPQLHFEIRQAGKPINPKPMLVAER